MKGQKRFAKLLCTVGILTLTMVGSQAIQALALQAQPHPAAQAKLPPRPPARPAQPQAKPVQPQARPAQPQIKTAQPQVKTAQPQVKTAQPQVKTAQPQVKTAPPRTLPTRPTQPPAKTQSQAKGQPPTDNRQPPSGGSKRVSDHEFQPKATVKTPNGSAKTDAHGHVRTLTTSAGTTHYGAHNERRTESKVKDGRLVGYSAHRGSLERDVPGHPGLHQRTSGAGSKYSTHMYRDGSYRGMHYERYVPSVRYNSRFYGWETRRWATPVAYNWGWQGQPWLTAAGGYFTPASSYADAAAMLADYIIAQELQEEYAVRQEAGDTTVNSGPVTPISDDVRARLAAEVRLGIENEQSGTTSTGGESAPEALDPKIQTFLVSSTLSLDTAGDTCPLAPGDVLFRVDANLLGTKVNIRVEDSQPGDCPVSTVSQLEIATLQEMHNHFREQMDDGQKVEAENEGKNGLPAGPAAGGTTTEDGQNAVDDSAALSADLAQQQQQASADEQQLQQADAPAPAAQRASLPPARPAIQIGLDFAQVQRIAGPPMRFQPVPPVGMIYYYNGYRVLFSRGKVVGVR